LDILETSFRGVYTDREGNIYTRNAVPGTEVYGEKLVNSNGIEYRQWIVKRSKLGAYLTKNPSVFPFSETSCVLYLGAATGTTCSHLSDICSSGKIFAVEFSPRVFRELLILAERRRNIFPILEDARYPNRYMHIVPPVDVVFQDISQRDQVSIFLRNVKTYLRKDGTGMLSLKARCIDFAKDPHEIYAETRKELESVCKVIEVKDLSPLEKDHAMFYIKV